MAATFLRFQIAAALGAVATLSGCMQATPPAPALQASAPLALKVHKQTEYHTLQIGPGGQASTLERDRLDAFIADLAISRPDSLHVTVGGTSNGALLQGVARILVEDGVDPKKIVLAPTRVGALATGSVTVEIDLYNINAPPCAPWSAVLSATSDNSAAPPDLGCSDLSNLGAMIADPRDLIQGSTTPYADGTTSAAAVQRYHEDNVKRLPPPSGFGVSASTGTSSTSGGK